MRSMPIKCERLSWTDHPGRSVAVFHSASVSEAPRSLSDSQQAASVVIVCVGIIGRVCHPATNVAYLNGSFDSGGFSLARHLSRPAGKPGATSGLILCHGFPIGPLDARQSGGTFPELTDRVASELGWVAMTFTFRGCGTSEGDFSLQGWVDDLRAAIDHLVAETEPSGIWLVGTNTGGSIATCVAADDPRVAGAALLSPRADFDDWAAQPRRLLEHAREIGSQPRQPRRAGR